MAKYKRKPEVVDAMQWTGHLPEMDDFSGCDCLFTEDKKGIQATCREFRPMIRGDWLVRCELGLLEVLSDVVFRARYDQIPDVVVPWEVTEESSNLAAYSYNGPKEELIIEFRSGGRYRYAGVDLKTFDGLRASKSKGAYFYAHIKDSHKWEKVVS